MSKNKDILYHDSELIIGIVVQEKQLELKKVNTLLRSYTTRKKNLDKQISELLYVKDKSKIYEHVSEIKDKYSAEDLKMLRRMKMIEPEESKNKDETTKG